MSDNTPKESLPTIMLEKAFDQKYGSNRPKPKATPKKPNTPVTNRAFRDHEGLRELQKQLHRQARPNKK